jgi:hypothetical protein
MRVESMNRRDGNARMVGDRKVGIVKRDIRC